MFPCGVNSLPPGGNAAFTPHELPIYNIRAAAWDSWPTAVPPHSLADSCCVELCLSDFFLLASPRRSCHPDVICLLWTSSPLALWYSVHRLTAEHLAETQELKFGKPYE